MLLVYYSYTQQTQRVAEAMADALRDRGCEVRQAAIGEIQIPDEIEGDYDLVCVGSPTWFFKPRCRSARSWSLTSQSGYWTDINLRSVRRLGAEQGGEYIDGVHFTFAGGQIRSLLSLISYLGRGENRERYLGLKIPPSLLKPGYLEQAREFANELADGLGGGHQLQDNGGHHK